jgi:TRAP-type C4-dicarboxylate transport system substrate-binding protein
MEEVQKDAGGTLQIQFFPGPALGTFRNIYDRVVAGVADMAFGTFGDLTGQFEKTSVTQLPTMSNAYIPTSIAIWRMYAKGVIADEFEKVRPLALYTFPGDGLHSPKPIKTLDDMKGLKIGLSSRIQSEAYSAIGAAPVTMIPTETYQSVQRGLVDAVSIGWPAVYTFKLNEVTKNHLSLGIGISPGYVFANKEMLAKLPEKPRAAIEKHSGEVFAKRMGTASFNADKETREALAKEGHTLVELGEADRTKLRTLLAPITDAWLKGNPEGQRVMDAYRQEVATVAASM